MRHRTTVLLLGALGCGGTDPGIPPVVNAVSPGTSTISSGPGFKDVSINFAKEDRRFAQRYAAGVDETARAVLTAFRVLQLPATTLSASPRVVGNERLTFRRAHGGRVMAAYFDCGTTNVGPLANSYRIEASLLAAVRPAPSDSASVEVRLTAHAFSNEGASGGAVDCGSTGELERRLLHETGVALQVVK